MQRPYTQGAGVTILLPRSAKPESSSEIQGILHFHFSYQPCVKEETGWFCAFGNRQGFGLSEEIKNSQRKKTLTV